MIVAETRVPDASRTRGAPVDTFVCPMCHGPLFRHDSEVTCGECGDTYPVADDGRMDLRLRRPRKVLLEFEIGGEIDPAAAVPPPDMGFLRANPQPEFDYRAVSITRELRHGNRLTPELLSHFPKAPAGKRSRMLDLGCGAQRMRPVCARAGYDYIGLDHDGDPMILGDAGALPFRDCSIDFIVSLGVLEHLHNPFVAMREACRVLKSGGTFIGTVAFLEPYHLRSYFHCSHLGTWHLLQTAGFAARAIAPNVEWSGLRALSQMGLFPHAPPWFARAMVLPALLAHRLWWRIGHALRADEATSEEQRVRVTTGGFRFVAVKPQ